jgi:hypothetical protein
MKKNEGSLVKLWDNIMQTNIHLIDIAQGKEKGKYIENLFHQLIAENIPVLQRDVDI